MTGAGKPMRVLLVCSGNTCRSPLAAAMLRDRLAGDPALAHIDVQSAGTSAWDGAPASEGAYLVALERGLDLSGHRARMLTTDLVRGADVILAMNEGHALRIADLGGGEKVHTMVAFAGRPDGVPREVDDPFGREVAAYRRTAELFDVLLEAAVVRLRAGLRR